MTHHDSHEHGDRNHHGGQEVTRRGSINEATQTNPGEHHRNAEEASKIAAKHALPPIPQAERRGSGSVTHSVQHSTPRESAPGQPTSRLSSRQPPTEARRSQQGGSWFDMLSTQQQKSRSELRLEKDFRDLQENYSELRKSHNNVLRQFYDLQHENQTQTSRTEAYIQDMRDIQKKLTEKNRELEDDKEMYEFEIQQAQLKSFRNMKQGRWLPLEESSIQGKLELLQSSLKQWAKSCAVKNMKEVELAFKQKPAEQTNLLQSLGQVVCLVDGVLPRELAEGKQAPFLCLNALLANEIYTHILADPFFFLEDDISPIIDSLPADSSILKQRPSPNLVYQEMYGTLMKVNPREAHLWRSQMLRVLSPSIQEDAHPSEKRVKTDTETLRHNVCSRHTAAFLEGPARHLLQPMQNDATSDRAQRLENIFQTAGKLSYQLWTQRTFFECAGLQALKSEPFSIGSPVMEMHPLVHLDEAPVQLNERPITMVVNPLVKVWGTDEAEDYDHCRVWAKAVVWLPLES